MTDEVKERKSRLNLEFVNLERMKMLDLKLYPYQLSSRLIGKYTRQDIKNYLLSPEIYMNQIQLRYISKYLYNVSSHYRRLINYFAGILTLDYTIDPYNLDPKTVDLVKFNKAYQKTISKIENMNIKHEFRKVLKIALREDTYYGYIHQSNDSFFLQALNPDYCKVSSVEDGLYNIAFNFNYFRAFPNRLQFFPVEFQQQYEAYCQDGQYWRELDPKMTICIKINEDLEYAIPPFVGIFANLLDIEDFKDLRKTKTEIDNYKLLHQKIPIRTGEENDDFAITLPLATKFHNNLVTNLPEQIGLATTPMDLELISFERDRPDINRVADSEKEFWNASGVNSEMFASNDTGSGAIALNASIKTDEAIMFDVLRQVERWLNRFLKYQGGSYKFRVSMLDTTIFNRQDVITSLSNLGMVGFPVKTRIVAAAGLPPSALTSLEFLENDVLNLQEKLVPMQTGYTQSGDGANPNDKGGRPEKEDSKISDSGAKAKDKKTNQNRASAAAK
ncbi:hypothetical protein QB910_000019 [Dabrowskivirus KKP3916]|uniref:Portal protein n=1 Tax=Alicyclobacillus phage KKP_3916 TaxID=3040651 RepID=A0AAT9V7K7_9CAUD|nr:hypothetical protein QB910_000019 [Alicyclobacillus phage KKP 3916]